MRLNADNVVAYLRCQGRVGPEEPISAYEMSGGVSNVVIYISRPHGGDFVLKQACEQLHVSEPWFCSVDRIRREVEVLHVCQRLTTPNADASRLRIEIPRLLFEDQENHLYAMTAAAPDHVVWKNELLSGRVRSDVAAACGDLLGRLHSETWHDLELAEQLDDREFFEDLRLDPFYRQIARVHSDLQHSVELLIGSVWSHRHCLVHGDFSPKNLLIYDDCLMLIDFEVGHFGDPAFDLGFFFSHLVLKALYHTPFQQPYFDLIDSFWKHYRSQMLNVLSVAETDELVQRAILNFAGCALARIDGKSKVNYLRGDEQCNQVRHLFRTIFAAPPERWEDVVELIYGRIASRAIQNADHAQEKAPKHVGN